MKVKYVGRPDQITTDYNGKRYVFQKVSPVSDIPIEVYDHVVRTTPETIEKCLEPIFQPEPKVEVVEEEIIKPEKKDVKKRGRK